MKSIIFFCSLLVISIFAYINQDDVVDFLVGPQKGQEAQLLKISKLCMGMNIETRSEDEAENYLDFQDSRSLDDDFDINPKAEKD